VNRCSCRNVAADEAEQVRLIEVYLSDLWCPERPFIGPMPANIHPGLPRFDSQWLRELNLAELQRLPYAEVLEAIRAA
jgi:hypothetical protein